MIPTVANLISGSVFLILCLLVVWYRAGRQSIKAAYNELRDSFCRMNNANALLKRENELLDILIKKRNRQFDSVSAALAHKQEELDAAALEHQTLREKILDALGLPGDLTSERLEQLQSEIEYLRSLNHP